MFLWLHCGDIRPIQSVRTCLPGHFLSVLMLNPSDITYSNKMSVGCLKFYKLLIER
jgi:hypothetical protein